MQANELGRLAGGFDIVMDGGELAQQGFVMNLSQYRWDVLGRVREVLQALASLLALLRPGGSLFVAVDGEPQEYLAGYLRAFPVRVSKVTTAENCGSDQSLYECRLGDEPIGRDQLEAVLTREVEDEVSHRRYANILSAVLPAGVAGGEGLKILDVGGGDGHMAEWWGSSGHRISVLEVDAVQAEAAKRRLGAERVTLHDGVSPWPFADQSFDACLLLFVLHHIAGGDALRRTLAEAARVSRGPVLVLEDQPRAAASPGLCRLAAAVTAEHFRPFRQDPAQFMPNIRPDSIWRSLFAGAGLRVRRAQDVAGTLQHPVPHTLYELYRGG